METVFDFSAAPHLPLSLRQDIPDVVRPEVCLSVLSGALAQTAAIRISERNGEIFIEVSDAA
jgi:hypothetical protein